MSKRTRHRLVTEIKWITAAFPMAVLISTAIRAHNGG
jgi:hypothetical protein